jgi:hypothetical protein
MTDAERTEGIVGAEIAKENITPPFGETPPIPPMTRKFVARKRRTPWRQFVGATTIGCIGNRIGDAIAFDSLMERPFCDKTTKTFWRFREAAVVYVVSHLRALKSTLTTNTVTGSKDPSAPWFASLVTATA